MDNPENRIIGALLLLLGVSCLAIAINTGQPSIIITMLKAIFKAAAT